MANSPMHLHATSYDYLRSMAYVKNVPKNFSYRSKAVKYLTLDSKFGKKDVLKCLKKYKEVYNFSEDGEHVYFMINESSVLEAKFPIDIYPPSFTLQLDLISSTPDATDLLLKLFGLLDHMAVKEKKGKGSWVRFSNKTHQGAVQVNKQFLRCPSFGEILKNYPPVTAKNMKWLFDLNDVKKYGSLIIWHGLPGCGKTYMIRALMKQWNDKYNFVVVTDPENFSSDISYYHAISSQSNDYVDDGDGRNIPKPTLFIMEDSADLIIQESRHIHFDKIGKLLNMTDGLMGQGKNDLILITFNEKVEKIDQAFLRPGRCIMNHEFGRFSHQEAVKWIFDKTGSGIFPGDNQEHYSLAELYAALIEIESGMKKVSANVAKSNIGFAQHAVE